jgi:hypothetical protein
MLLCLFLGYGFIDLLLLLIIVHMSNSMLTRRQGLVGARVSTVGAKGHRTSACGGRIRPVLANFRRPGRAGDHYWGSAAGEGVLCVAVLVVVLGSTVVVLVLLYCDCPLTVFCCSVPRQVLSRNKKYVDFVNFAVFYLDYIQRVED